MLGRSDWPRLAAENFVVIGPRDQTYNCIAWSLGIIDRWVVARPYIDTFDTLYRKHGFKPANVDARLDPSLEKVVVFAEGDSIVHAVKQELDGSWTSKMGPDFLIRHTTLEAVGGGAYGQPVRMYVRPRASSTVAAWKP